MARRASWLLPLLLWSLPAAAEAARPVLASITFRRSAGRLAYLASFIAITKIVLDIRGMPAAVSVWYLAISCSLIGGNS